MIDGAESDVNEPEVVPIKTQTDEDEPLEYSLTDPDDSSSKTDSSVPAMSIPASPKSPLEGDHNSYISIDEIASQSIETIAQYVGNVNFLNQPVMPTNRINHEVEPIEDHVGIKTDILELNSTKNEKSFLLVDNSRENVEEISSVIGLKPENNETIRRPLIQVLSSTEDTKTLFLVEGSNEAFSQGEETKFSESNDGYNLQSNAEDYHMTPPLEATLNEGVVSNNAEDVVINCSPAISNAKDTPPSATNPKKLTNSGITFFCENIADLKQLDQDDSDDSEPPGYEMLYNNPLD